MLSGAKSKGVAGGRGVGFRAADRRDERLRSQVTHQGDGPPDDRTDNGQSRDHHKFVHALKASLRVGPQEGNVGLQLGLDFGMVSADSIPLRIRLVG